MMKGARFTGGKEEFIRQKVFYDEETAYDSNLNPEPGFQSGLGDPANTSKMVPCLSFAKSSPPSEGTQKYSTVFFRRAASLFFWMLRLERFSWS